LQVKAVARNIHASPQKLRLILDQIKGKGVEEALAILHYHPKANARLVAKVVKAAAANAENNYGLDRRRLYVAAAFADKGITLKRLRPRARGRASIIQKRHSHITIVVDERGG